MEPSAPEKRFTTLRSRATRQNGQYRCVLSWSCVECCADLPSIFYRFAMQSGKHDKKAAGEKI